MKCQKCGSERIGEISSKSSDCNFIRVGDYETDGYMETDIGLGGGDYIEFDWCLQCGQIQGEFPLPISDIEKGEEENFEKGR